MRTVLRLQQLSRYRCWSTSLRIVVFICLLLVRSPDSAFWFQLQRRRLCERQWRSRISWKLLIVSILIDIRIQLVFCVFIKQWRMRGRIGSVCRLEDATVVRRRNLAESSCLQSRFWFQVCRWGVRLHWWMWRRKPDMLIADRSVLLCIRRICDRRMRVHL